jgi:heme exporter protein B
MSTLTATLALVQRDFMVEARSKEIFIPLGLFCLVLLLLFVFSLSPLPDQSRQLFPALYLTLLALSGILALEKAIERERRDDGLYGIVVSPVGLSSLYLGKTFSTLAFLFVVGIVSIPVFIAFLGLSLSWLQLLWIVWVEMLFLFGFSALGTIMTLLSWNVRARHVLLAVLLYPLMIPPLLASSSLMRQWLNGRFEMGSGWGSLLVGFDLLYFGMGLLLIEHVLEE